MATDNNENLSPDIYQIANYVESVRKNFTPEVDSDVMMLGIFGYFDQMFSNLFQNSIVMASEFSNESIASKAKFEKNVISHALGLGMTDLNAIPATLDVVLTFIEEDIERATGTDSNKAWRFVFDKDSKIFFGDKEFHTDYDIIINKVKVTTAGPGKDFAYTARYDMEILNNISGVTNPYLSPPTRMKYEGLQVIMIKCTLHQVTNTVISTKVLSDNSIASKIITFDFDNVDGQLADFTIDVATGSGSIHMVPVYDGLTLLAVSSKYPYFYYSYLNEHTIRIKFDRNSYMPKINAEVDINLQTTLGEDGNFTLKKQDDEATYPVFNFSSERLGYSNISCKVLPTTGESVEGTNKKTVEELKKIIPKEALSRGSITNLTDLQNYFNVIDTAGKLHLYKKRDNALERLYYTFMVMKNSMDVVIPTNTIDLKVTADQLLHEENGKWTLKRGTYIRFGKRDKNYGYIADTQLDPDTGIPSDFDPNDKDDFLYMVPYGFAINKSPLYGMYYLTTIDETKILDFQDINESCVYQYIATSIKFRRGYVNNPNKYILTVDVAQNVADADSSLVTYSVPENPEDTPEIIASKVKCYIVFFNEKGVPYKWSKGKITYFTPEGNVFGFEFNFGTNDIIDVDNRIKINTGLYNPGDDKETYGFFKHNTIAKLFILSNQEPGKGLMDNPGDWRTNLAEVIPATELDPNQFSWTNTYNIIDGLDFFYDFSEIITSTIIVKNAVEEDEETGEYHDQCEGCQTSCEVFCTSCVDTCAGSCVEECSINCRGGCEVTCSNDCVGTCKNTCEDTCTGGCYESCKNTCRNSCADMCGGNCTSGCTKTCSNDCTGTCKGTSMEITCDDCTGTCLTSCSDTCVGTCVVSCGDDCTTSCVGGCLGTCSGSCTETCGNSCSFDESFTGGNPNCNGDCVTSCSGFCVDSCTGTCSNTETNGAGGITDRKYTVTIEGAPMDSDNNKLAKVIINGMEYQGPHTFKINEGTKIQLWIYNMNEAGTVEVDGTIFKGSQIITLDDNYTIALGTVHKTENGITTAAGMITAYSSSYIAGTGSAGCNNSCTKSCTNTCLTTCVGDCTGTSEETTTDPTIKCTVQIVGSPYITVTDPDGSSRRLELAYVVVNNNVYQGNRTFEVNKNDIIGLYVEDKYGNAVIKVNRVDVSEDFYNLTVLTDVKITLDDVGLGSNRDGMIIVEYDTASVIPASDEENTEVEDTAVSYTTRVSSVFSAAQNQIRSMQAMASTPMMLSLASEETEKEEETETAIPMTFASFARSAIVSEEDADSVDTSTASALMSSLIESEVISRASNTVATIPYQFIIKQVPVIKYNYFGNDENVVNEFCNELVTKKSYIDYACQILEDAFGVDFKFFNTYGPSKLSSIDPDGAVTINRTCLSLTFKVKFTTNYDTNIENDILQDIKAEIENIDEINSLHIPNLITTITNKYRDSIIYFEFVDMNGYGPGVQHIYAQQMPDGVITPELLNVNTRDDGTPDITLIIE